MKVLHLTSSFPRREGDHHAPFMAALMAAQARAGIDVVVLAPHDQGLPTAERMGAAAVRRFRYGPPRAEVLAYRGGLVGTTRSPAGAAMLGPFLAAFSAAAARLARAERVDVVHAHWWLPGGLAGTLAARAARVPLVVTCHGSDVELAAHPGSRWRAPARAVLGRAALVAAVSDALSERIRTALGIGAQTLRMPVPHLPGPGDEPPAPAPAVPEGMLRLLCVGRLSGEKGFDVAVAAVARLAAAGRDVSLEVAGEGPARPALEAAARSARSAGGAVRLVGALSPAELSDAYRRVHAVLVPSRHEGLGLVALEALAHGRPVIASAVGGLAEVVKPGDGLLVPPGDVAALAEAIGRLPLPPPVGSALAAHRPEEVGRAHLEAYGRALAGRAR